MSAVSEDERRLDVELVSRGLARSRGDARDLIGAGAVTVPGRRQVKASTPVTAHTAISVSGEAHWVARSAHKLLAALDAFPEIDPAEARCIDVGACTGGFTQVLLSRGASHVTALDVGHGQLADELTSDPRVTEQSGCNIRHVDPTAFEPFDLAVADLSFISLRLVLPVLVGLADTLLLLVKPQFEVGRQALGKNGLVRDRREHARVLSQVCDDAADLGCRPRGLVASPIPGSTGNREYLLWLSMEPPAGDLLPAEQLISNAVQEVS